MSATVTPIRADVELTNADYHASPALSSSGARDLISGTPAEFKWKRETETHSKTFDMGNAVHALALGDPMARIHVVEFMDWRAKAAQEERKKAYANGEIPLNLVELAEAQQMVLNIKANPIAAELFDPDHGQPERSLFYTDPETGIELRCRPDWLPEIVPGRRLIIPDLKTAVSAKPAAFARAAVELGYHQQDAWYRDAAIACGLDDDPAFLFVVVEKKAPYLVSVYRLDDEAVNIGRKLNRDAIRTFVNCTESGEWPGYGEGVHTVSLPDYYTSRLLQEEVDQL